MSDLIPRSTTAPLKPPTGTLDPALASIAAAPVAATDTTEPAAAAPNHAIGFPPTTYEPVTVTDDPAASGLSGSGYGAGFGSRAARGSSNLSLPYSPPPPPPPAPPTP